MPRSTTNYDENLDGLAAAYWDTNAQLAGPADVHTRDTGTLDQTWAAGSPPIGANEWSARYTGDITFPATGAWKLNVDAHENQSLRVVLDDTPVVDTWSGESALDAASWATGSLDVVARGTNNELMHMWYPAPAPPNTWSAWESLGGTLTSDPSVAAGSPGILDVFGRGTDNALWHRAYRNNTWQPWERLGGDLASAPDAVWVGGDLHVFTRGTDGQLWQIWWNGGTSTWSSWLPRGGSLVDDPTVTRDGNTIHVYTHRAADNALGHVFWSGSTWEPWESLGGTVKGSPDAASWATNRQDVFIRGTDDQLYQRFWNGSTWSSWLALGGTLDTSPGVASWGNGRLDVFIQGTDNRIYTRYHASGWSAWTPIASNFRVGDFNATSTTKPVRVRIETAAANPGDTEPANLQLRWSGPGTADQVVPAARLNPRFGLVTSTVDPDGKRNATTFANPANGLPTVQTVDPTGLALATQTAYESVAPTHFNRRVTRTLPAGNPTTYKYYGTAGNATSVAPPATCNPADPAAVHQGGGLYQTTTPDPDGPQTARVDESIYDKVGRPIAVKTNNEAWTCLKYDARGRLTTKTIPGYGAEPARTVTHNYAVGGNPLVTSVSDAAGTITTTTDLLGRVVSYSDVWAKTTTTSYSQAGTVTQVVTPIDTFTYTYDPAGRVELVTLGGVTIADPVYDTAGRLNTVTYPTGAGNGTSLAPIGRDALGRLTGLTWKDPTSATITSDSVTRKLSGDVKDQSIDGVDANPGGDNFTYDGAGRLTQAVVPGHTLTYGFAGTGGCGSLPTAGKNTNRTSMTDNAGPATTYCYDNTDALTSTNTPGMGTITYDSHGNTATLGAQTMGYDGADRHVTTDGNGTTLRYTRDATDRIVSRVTWTPSPITFRADAANDNGTGSTSLTLNRPAGTQANDALIAQVVAAGGTGTTITAPSGWTLIATATNGTNVRTSTYRHLAAGGDPANWTWTLSTSKPAAGGIAAYAGVDTTNPIDVTATATANTATSHDAPTVTTTAWNGLHLAVHGLTTATTVTPAAGATERHDRPSAGTTPVTAELADAPLTTPGATGVRTATSPAAASSASQTITLRPASTPQVQVYTYSGDGDTPDITYGLYFTTPERQIGLPGGAAVTKRSTGTDTWSYPNIHGDITATANQTGTKQGATHTYDPYGNPAGALPDNSQGDYDYGWLGQHQRGLEHNPGLLPTIEMGARQYSAILGRFLEVDPVEGGTSSDYGYVDDPINGYDLTGLCETATVKCVMGILRGKKTLPKHFAKWLKARSKWVYYADTRNGKRALLNGKGVGCSVPGIGDVVPAFRGSCRTHDLGYDLMRFFRSSGRLGSIRRAVDSNFRSDLSAVCGGQSWVRKLGCYFVADSFHKLVDSVSVIERYRTPG